MQSTQEPQCSRMMSPPVISKATGKVRLLKHSIENLSYETWSYLQ
jgi:hypothetical protein